MSGNTDPRVRATAASVRCRWSIPVENHPDDEMCQDFCIKTAAHMLTAADAADRAAGIVRVRVDDETVERVARALWDRDMAEESPEWREMAWNDMGGAEPSWERGEYDLRARAVLAALRGES